jgi:Domain of unknown function (DUF4157)
VVFGQGYFEPASQKGRYRLLHELVHVQQQRKGPVSGTDNGGGVAISDPADSFEQEAETKATRIASTPPLVGDCDPYNGHRGRPPTRWTAARYVQRCGGMPCDCTTGEEDTVQRNSVDTPAPQAVQRAVVCPVGVDPAEGTGCYEVPDSDLPGNGISSQPANDNATAGDMSGAANDNATAGDMSGAANDNATAGDMSGTANDNATAGDIGAEGAEAAEVGEAAEDAEIAEGIIETGSALEFEPGIGTIIGTALIIGGAGYLAYKALTSDDGAAPQTSAGGKPNPNRTPISEPERDPATGQILDPLTGEPLEREKRPCDDSPMTECSDLELDPIFGSRAEALAYMQQLYPGARLTSTDVQASKLGNCFKDGNPRDRDFLN